MHIAVAVIGYALAVYFFVAVFVPHIRLRWGTARGITLAKSGVSKQRSRLPYMGTISCLGSALFISALATVFVGTENTVVVKVALPLLLIGFILGIVGQLKDTRGGKRWRRY